MRHPVSGVNRGGPPPDKNWAPLPARVFSLVVRVLIGTLGVLINRCRLPFLCKYLINHYLSFSAEVKCEGTSLETGGYKTKQLTGFELQYCQLLDVVSVQDYCT